jgi:hypothetical protein
MPDEHKVHPYAPPEILCRGESCIRPFRSFYLFFIFSDNLSVVAPTFAKMKITAIFLSFDLLIVPP